MRTALLLIFSGLTFFHPHIQQQTIRQEEDSTVYNPEWLKLDEANLINLNTLLNDAAAVKSESSFMERINKLNILHKKDLGFGLTFYECAQYGGYTTAWISLLAFNGQIIQYDIRYKGIDTKAIDKLKIQQLSLKKDYSWRFDNKEGLQEFKKTVAKKLGIIKPLKKHKERNFYTNYDVLTNPIHFYDFGTWCYLGLQEPEGRISIKYFVGLNDTETIRQIIRGYNPEGRLYAIQALLEMADANKILLTEDDKTVINTIVKMDIPINICNGCIGGHLPASQVLNSSLLKLLK